MRLEMKDRRTTYSRLQEMLWDYYRLGNKEISFVHLENLIIKNIGSSNRTIIDAMRVMSRTKLIEDLGDARFRIVRINLE